MPNMEQFAVSLDSVSKEYRLKGGLFQDVMEALGIGNATSHIHKPGEVFTALDGVSLQVKKGSRLGIVGRNGAGKTSLLKLLCGNYQPTSGTVSVSGNIQALMNIGVGFHPDFTGMENIKASLLYNGLARDEFDEAVESIVDFCELGQFIDQPFKNYSLGMQSRLMFACATAIKPDILIVDEVLGAGDGYFLSKSKARVEGLIRNGCTMLLVSHSMQQVLELCDDAVWLDKGKVRLYGPAFEVVKEYEQYLSHEVEALSDSTDNDAQDEADVHALQKDRNRQLQEVIAVNQAPDFAPGEKVAFPSLPELTNELDFSAPGGVSRWTERSSLLIDGFYIENQSGKTNQLQILDTVRFVFRYTAQSSISGKIRFGVAIHNSSGVCATRIFSPLVEVSHELGDVGGFCIELNPLQLGVGDYTVGVSINTGTLFEEINNSEPLELLSRSFQFSVSLPGRYGVLDGQFQHSAGWRFYQNL